MLLDRALRKEASYGHNVVAIRKQNCGLQEI